MSPRAADPPGEPPPVVAAGAVLWRRRDGHIEVGLVHRPRYDDWSLPKGKQERGEHLLLTASREVEEETGATVRLGPALGTISYDVLDSAGHPRAKVVHFWSGEHLSGEHIPNDEVDRLAWCPLSEARSRLTRASEAEVLDRFAALPCPTTPVVLLRHAHAAPRHRWDGPDDQRPLSEQGQSQARRLAALLTVFGALEVLASPSTRTRQTVDPYLRAVGLRPRLDGRLRESRALGEEVRLLESRWGRPTLLCTHRPVLPALLDAVRARAVGTLPPVPPLDPGGFVVAHTYPTGRGWRVATWEQHVG